LAKPEEDRLAEALISKVMLAKLRSESRNLKLET